MSAPRVEWDRLSIALSKLRKDDLVDILGRAYDALPRTRLAQVFGDHVDLEKVSVPKGQRSIAAGRLLEQVQQFHRDSLAGKYYESFNVNSKNYMEKSQGTQTWIAEVDRLFGQCVVVSGKGHHQQALEAMDLLFDLLHRIDTTEDIIFLADERDSWQVGVDYGEIFPSYFASLAATADPDAFARRVRELIEAHQSYRRDQHLKSASKVASSAQRRALRTAQ